MERGVQGRDAPQVELDEAAGGELAGGEGAVDGVDSGLLQLERNGCGPTAVGDEQE